MRVKNVSKFTIIVKTKPHVYRMILWGHFARSVRTATMNRVVFVIYAHLDAQSVKARQTVQNVFRRDTPS